MAQDKIIKSNEEWQQMLAPDVYRITREKDTEPAFTGRYYAMKDNGVYRCSNLCHPREGGDPEIFFVKHRVFNKNLRQSALTILLPQTL